MKNLSKNLKKISILVIMLVCLFGMTYNVKAGLLSNIGTASSLISTAGSLISKGAQIANKISPIIFGLIEQGVPTAWNITKTLTQSLTEKLDEKLQEENEEDPVVEENQNVEEDPVEIVYGDVNCDEEVNEDDLALLAQYILMMDEIDEQGLKNADICLDGKIDGYDFQTFSKYINNEIKEIPVELAESERDQKEINLKIEEDDEVKYGDINCDGEVNKDDLELLAEHVLKTQEIEDEQALKNANIALDDEIDGYDFAVLNEFIDEKIKIEELPLDGEELKKEMEEQKEADKPETIDETKKEKTEETGILGKLKIQNGGLLKGVAKIGIVIGNVITSDTADTIMTTVVPQVIGVSSSLVDRVLSMLSSI